MKISEAEVAHVAKLSKLAFNAVDTTAFATSLSKIVDMVELLKEVDTTGIPATTTMADSTNVMRDDIAKQGLDRKDLFKNVPQEDKYRIKVPAILEEGGDA